MANGRKSYFEEKRSQYSDPNFFNKSTSIDDVANNVKRIVKDAKFGMIVENDYVYFQNPNVINTCVQVAYKSSIESMTCANALQFYINQGLNKGYAPAGFEQICEINNATNAYNAFSRRAYTWLNLYQMFSAIQNGCDVRMCLHYIETIDKGAILDL